MKPPYNYNMVFRKRPSNKVQIVDQGTLYICGCQSQPVVHEGLPLSGVARKAGGRGGGLPRVSPFWGDTILRCETITPPICGEYLSFFHFVWSLSSFGTKTH